MTPPEIPTTHTTGSWRPYPGHEDAFLDAWIEFANWSCQAPGAHVALLARDLRDPGRFISFIGWDSIDAVRAWKASPEFKPQMARVQAHVDKFAPTELDLVAVAGATQEAHSTSREPG